MTTAGLFLALALAAPAQAGPFDGRWSSASGACGKDQAEENAPVLIRNGRYDQHEAHCRWGALTPAGVGAWTAKGTCSVEGSPSKGAFRFALSGTELSMRGPDGVTTRYRRCPAR